MALIIGIHHIILVVFGDDLVFFSVVSHVSETLGGCDGKQSSSRVVAPAKILACKLNPQPK
jgi:hypothetical protein